RHTSRGDASAVLPRRRAAPVDTQPDRCQIAIVEHLVDLADQVGGWHEKSRAVIVSTPGDEPRRTRPLPPGWPAARTPGRFQHPPPKSGGVNSTRSICT